MSTGKSEGKICAEHAKLNLGKYAEVVGPCIYPDADNACTSDNVNYHKDLHGKHGHSVLVKFTCCNWHQGHMHVYDDCGPIAPVGKCGCGPCSSSGTTGLLDGSPVVCGKISEPYLNEIRKRFRFSPCAAWLV